MIYLVKMVIFYSNLSTFTKSTGYAELQARGHVTQGDRSDGGDGGGGDEGGGTVFLDMGKKVS